MHSLVSVYGAAAADNDDDCWLLIKWLFSKESPSLKATIYGSEASRDQDFSNSVLMCRTATTSFWGSNHHDDYVWI
jgi:hypothetical protein